MAKKDPQLSPIIAHRGASAYAPENTLVAFHLASEMGAKWIECDVRRIKTNELVIIHDSNVKTTTNGFGQIKHFSFSQIKNLDAGSWFSDKFKEQHIPTLDQVIKICTQGGVSLNLEMKGGIFDRQTVPLLVQYLARYWPTEGPDLLVSSSNKRMLNQLRLLSPQLPLSLITQRLKKQDLSFMKKINAFSCHVNVKGLSQCVIDRIKSMNLRVGVFTINNASHARELLNMGVDTVFSDHPDLLNN